MWEVFWQHFKTCVMYSFKNMWRPLSYERVCGRTAADFEWITSLICDHYTLSYVITILSHMWSHMWQYSSPRTCGIYIYIYIYTYIYMIACVAVQLTLRLCSWLWMNTWHIFEWIHRTYFEVLPEQSQQHSSGRTFLKSQLCSYFI